MGANYSVSIRFAPSSLLLDLKNCPGIDYLWRRFACGEHRMPQDSLRYSGQRSKMKWIAWGLASLLFFFTVENIWVDPWLRSKHHRMPSLVPEALSGTWFLAFAVGGIALILLFLTEILLIRDRAGSLWTK